MRATATPEIMMATRRQAETELNLLPVSDSDLLLLQAEGVCVVGSEGMLSRWTGRDKYVGTQGAGKDSTGCNQTGR